MNKILSTCSLILFAFAFSYAQSPSSQVHRVFVLANTADIPDEELINYTDALHQMLMKISDPFTLIFNGDLSNQKKFTQNSLNYDSIRISLLLKATQFGDNRQILIPGDRDWLNSGEDGWKYFQTLEKIIEKENKNARWIPGKGCPGPKDVLLDEHLLLVGINTQFWNHPFERPTPTEAVCPISRDGDFVEELENIIEDAGNKNILMVGHYPLISNGIYGGRTSFKRHLFPFTDQYPNLYFPMPVLGSLYAAYRQNIGDKLDLANKRFNPMRETLMEVMAENRSMVYLSGHEKNVQILKFKDNFFINSGAAKQVSFARKDPRSLMVSKNPGILELIYFDDGRVNSQLYDYENFNFLPSNPINLLNSPCLTEKDLENVNFAYVPCKKEFDIPPLLFPYSGVCTAKGGKEYKATKLKQLVLGRLYRDTWTQSIMAPFLNLRDTYGGLRVLERGGGVQTQSLKFSSGDGEEYVFRSTNKNPSKALPLELRTKFFTSLARQATATQHPYGAIAVDKLLNHTDILHVHPVLYLMPDDPRLGPFRTEFSGLLGMLEERPKHKKGNRPASFDADDIVRSYELFRALYENHKNQVDVTSLLKSRVFDIWIGDRGRHEENFTWARYKERDRNLYKPIPRDRDHAFSILDGFFPWLIDRPWALPFFEHFDYTIHDLKSLNFSARHLDRFLLSRASKEDWLEVSKEIQEIYDTEKIEAAIRAMPPETFELSGKEIIQKLEKRLIDLDTYILRYYRILAKEVDVVGSNEREFFEIIRNADATVLVRMYDVHSFEERQKGNRLLYERLFYPEETKEIRVFGLGSKDIIEISGSAEKSIKVRALGGDGEDYIVDRSTVKGVARKPWYMKKIARAP